MKTVYIGGEGEIVEKKSRFIATVRPVASEEEAVAFIAEMKKKYWDARHNCSAFVIGDRQELSRCSDDGEPAQTASITSISLSHGNEKLQNYFSYANTTGHGIIGKHNLSKHNLTFRETSVLLNSRLKLDGSMNLMRQVVKNKPTVGGFYMNPLVGLYRFPRYL